MIIDIKTIFGNLPKADSIDWYIYTDSNKEDLFFNKSDDRSGNYYLDIEIDVTKDYYLFIDVLANNKTMNLGPFVLSYKNVAALSSNNIVSTPVITITTEKDSDGKITSLTFTGSDYKGITEYDNSIWRLKDGDTTVLSVINNKTSITVQANQLQKSVIYKLELLYRSKDGLSNTIVPFYFILNDDNVKYYYVVNNTELIVDKLIEYYLDKTKLINNVIGDNVLVSLLVKELNGSVTDDINSIIDITDGNVKTKLEVLKDKVNSLLSNVDVSSITNVTIREIVQNIKDKYSV